MTEEITTAGPTQFERNWAMLAHLSALLTAVVGFSSGGVGTVVTLLVPLGIYLYFGSRSRFVAFQALQATVFQALGAIAYVVLGASAGAAIAMAWTITGLLSVVLIGLLLIPLALLVTLLAGLALVAFPVAWLAYSLVAAYRTYEGEDYHYPWIGPLVAQAVAPAAYTAPAA